MTKVDGSDIEILKRGAFHVQNHSKYIASSLKHPTVKTAEIGYCRQVDISRNRFLCNFPDLLKKSLMFYWFAILLFSSPLNTPRERALYGVFVSETKYLVRGFLLCLLLLHFSVWQYITLTYMKTQ